MGLLDACMQYACHVSGVDSILCLARLSPPSSPNFGEKFIKEKSIFALSCLTIASRESELQRGRVRALALGLEIMNHLKALQQPCHACITSIQHRVEVCSSQPVLFPRKGSIKWILILFNMGGCGYTPHAALLAVREKNYC